MESTRQPSSLRYEARRIDVIHRYGGLELEDAIDDVDRLFDAGGIDQAELAVLDLRQFGHRSGFSLRNRDVDSRVIFVDDPTRLVRLGECILHAANCRGDEATYDVGLGRDDVVSRNDAVAIEAHAGIDEG